jgi:hypothetical protein
LETKLYSISERNYTVKAENDNIIIQGRNYYNGQIITEKGKYFFNLTGILSAVEAEKLKQKDKTAFEKRLGLSLNLYEPGNRGYGYNTIWHHSEIKLSSKDLENLTKKEFEILLDLIYKFIKGIEVFKQRR